jgi:hypothetical protein
MPHGTGAQVIANPPPIPPLRWGASKPEPLRGAAARGLQNKPADKKNVFFLSVEQTAAGSGEWSRCEGPSLGCGAAFLGRWRESPQAWVGLLKKKEKRKKLFKILVVAVGLQAEGS